MIGGGAILGALAGTGGGVGSGSGSRNGVRQRLWQVHGGQKVVWCQFWQRKWLELVYALHQSNQWQCSTSSINGRGLRHWDMSRIPSKGIHCVDPITLIVMLSSSNAVVFTDTMWCIGFTNFSCLVNENFGSQWPKWFLIKIKCTVQQLGLRRYVWIDAVATHQEIQCEHGLWNDLAPEMQGEVGIKAIEQDQNEGCLNVWMACSAAFWQCACGGASWKSKS
jgi:hypothetical protein